MKIESLKLMSLEKLVELFETTTNITDPMIATVRGWLMDVIEEKNPEGFDAWLESDNCTDESLRAFVL